MTRKSKFAQKAESVLTGRVTSLEEFLDDKPVKPSTAQQKSEITVNHINGNTDKQMDVKPDKLPNSSPDRRFELKIPDHLAKQINDHAFERRMPKAAVVIEALEKYFSA